MSLNATNLYIQASPLPATFKGTPNDLFTEMIKRMKILSPSGTNFIYVGDSAPTSNVGPWLRGGTQWWVYDPNTKTYIPQDISASFTQAFFIGNSVPTSTNPTVWLRTTKNATTAAPLDYGDMIRWFNWNGSAWVSPHHLPPSGNDRHIWVGSETEVWSYDGGDGNNPGAIAPTETSGAMWQVDANFSFRFPIGVGTNPVTYDGNPASAVGVGATGGAERHKLIESEMPSHKHTVGGKDDASGGGGARYLESPGIVFSDTSNTGGDLSHQNMPPYIGVYFIKRTARKFYTP